MFEDESLVFSTLTLPGTFSRIILITILIAMAQMSIFCKVTSTKLALTG
jgi:hypothetical protein